MERQWIKQVSDTHLSVFVAVEDLTIAFQTMKPSQKAVDLQDPRRLPWKSLVSAVLHGVDKV